MPGAVPRTSTFALTNVTMPYVLKLANQTLKQAVISDPGIRDGINVFEGHVTFRGVAESLGLQYKPVSELLY
jgi:alanine dehydrogenase